MTDSVDGLLHDKIWLARIRRCPRPFASAIDNENGLDG
jgi:hypothetical protein